MQTDKKMNDSESKYDRRSGENHGSLSFNRIFFLDFLLLNVSFFFCYYLKRGDFDLSRAYFLLLWLFYLCWLISSFMGNKFRLSQYRTYGTGMFSFFKSSLYLTYLITFSVVIFGLTEYSRIHIFSTCLMLLVLDGAVWSFYNKTFRSRATDRVSLQNLLEPLRIEKNISYSLIVADLVLVLFSFFAVNYVKLGQLALLEDYYRLLMIFVGVWFVVSMMTSKFSVGKFKSIHFFSWQWIKAGFIMLAVMSLLFFGARLFHFSRFQALGSIVILMALELILVNVYYRIVRVNGKESDIESVDFVKNVLEQEELPLDVDIDFIRKKLMEPAREKLRTRFASRRPEVFEFMDRHMDLNDMVRMETAVERSNELVDLDADRVPVRLFLNLWKINDIRRLNAYFLRLHRLLLPGGYFVGHAHTIHTHYEWIYNKYPKYIALTVYAADFCFNRIMPKLPWLQKIYFSLTRGKGRVLSRAELLGRLCFCGFEIVAEKEIDQRLYVIARKVKTPSLDKSPTYGPLVQLKRSGLNGEMVNIYKFRTMHPYSEYLQQYVYEKQGLREGGKLEDDFRMTTWGKFMRRFWLDELPMLYNWLKGDLGIVGVRPLSFHYLSLYDIELQKLREKVKPGLIPPFYVDMPETVEEICDSERRYIHSFLEKPVKTQCVYFWKAVVNILFKGARSN
ncbi:MAG: sugar transferase [Desulfobacteraceae bacterium]